MLKLSRKTGQTVVIDTPQGTIVISADRRVKLSIEAPKEHAIRRGELERKAA